MQNHAYFIRPILRGRDIKRYSYEFADKWLIYVPWHFPLHKDTSITGASKEAEHEFEKQYPAIYNRLLSYKPILEKRNKAETGIRYEWYALQRCAATYMDDFSKQKIVYSEIVQKPQFYLDDGRFYVEATSFLLTGKNLEYLIACLNSKPVSYFFKTFYAGGGLGEKGFRYKKAFLTNLPIPKIKSIEYNNEYFKNLIENSEIIKIDKMIYKIFDLTSEEIEYIENTINI